MASIYSIASAKLQSGQLQPSQITTARLVADSYVFDPDDTLGDITAIDTTTTFGLQQTQDGVEVTLDMSDLNITTTSSATAGWVVLCTDTDPVFAIDIGTIDTNELIVQIIWNALGIASGYRGYDTPEWMERVVRSTDNDINYTLRLNGRIDSLYPNVVFSFAPTQPGQVNGMEHTGIVYQIIYDDNTNDADNQYSMKLFDRLRGLSLLQGADLFSFNLYDTGQIGGLSNIEDMISGYFINATYDATASYDLQTIGFPVLSVTRGTTTAEIDCTNLPTGYGLKLFRGSDNRGTKIPTTELIDLDAIDLPYTDAGLNASLNYKYFAKFTASGDINGSPTTLVGRQGSSRISVPSNAVIP